MFRSTYQHYQPILRTVSLAFQRLVQIMIRFFQQYRPSAQLLFWCGCIVVSIVSFIPYDIPGAAPTHRNIMYGRLTSEHQYSQTFHVEEGTLIGIALILFPPANPSDNLITLYLGYDDPALPRIAETSLPQSALNPYGMTIFTIEPFSVTTAASLAIATLRLDIVAPTLPVNNWISVVAGPNTYTEGQLLVDGDEKPTYDLAFQPIYRVTWFDRWVPVSRVAQGKPGLLGMPLFYALIIYMCVFIVALLLVRFWQFVRYIDV